MESLIKKIIKEETKKLLKESGIRDIKALAKRYPMAKIYFHQDLDGVTTALAMKNYLERYGIEVIDAEIIQYGSKEFAIEKIQDDARGDVMPVLVDFAHGKPMFVIHTDHHDTQAGVEQGTATNFKPSRSNVKGVKENKKMMGLVANKLLLAFKNKPNFLRNLVMNSKPSLQNILLNIKDQMKKEGYAPIEQLQQNQEKYIQSRKDKGVTYEDGIISQYGLGSMKPGSYDRYTPFINHPDAEFLVTGLPMGMVQASCNPYKKERALKGVDLGEIKNEVLENFKSELESQRISFGTIKRIAEMDAQEKSVGFTLKDMLAIYGNAPSFTFRGTERQKKYLDHLSKKLFKNLDTDIKKLFNLITVNGYDVIQANSGGHKCITNISGINFLYSKSKFQDTERKTRGSYVDLLKDIQAKFVEVLKNKIEKQKNLQEFTISKKTIKNKF